MLYKNREKGIIKSKKKEKNIMPANEWNNITKEDINSGIVNVTV